MPAETSAVADAPTQTEPNQTPAPEPVAAQAAQAERAPAVNNKLLAALGIPDDVARQVFAAPESAPPPPEETKAEEQSDAPTKPQGEQEAPPEATTEEAKPEGEDGEEDGDPEGAEPPDSPAWAKQRIGKLTAQREKLRAERDSAAQELAEAQERIAQLEAQPGVTVAPSESDPLADVNDLYTLQQRVDDALFTKEWALEYPDGVTVNEGTDKEKFVTPEEMRRGLIKAEKILNRYAPRKAHAIQLQAENDAIAQKQFPDIFKRGSDLYQAAQVAMREIPGLATHPARHLFIGYYYKGLEADIAADEKAKSNGTNGAKPALDPRLTAAHVAKIPPLAPVTANPPSFTGKPSGEKQIAAAKQQVMQEAGSRDSIVALVRAQREQRERGATNPQARAPT